MIFGIISDMKLFNKPPTFIEAYDDALSPEGCRAIIKNFEDSPKSKGSFYNSFGSIVADDIKKSIEIAGVNFKDNTQRSALIFDTIHRCLAQYLEKYIHPEYVQVANEYSFQQFKGVGDGFKQWHYEHGPTDDTCKRVLVWSIYLNNAKSGTEFMYYPTVKAKEGRCVLFPASYTHTHRSEANKDLKYLVSGWFNIV